MNAYKGTEPYIFLSYAHADKEIVDKIIVGLKQDMCRVWYDEGLTPGESWNDDLAEHLKNAAVVVVVLTQSAIISQYVKAEINYAISKKIKLIPVFLEQIDLPAGLEMMLSSTQYLNLYNEDINQQISGIISNLPGTVFATKKVPFCGDDKYSFYLKKRTIPNPNAQYDTSSDGFQILCRSTSGEERILFEFDPIPAYDIEYTVTQCKTVKDDYFVGEIRGINIVNILADCCLSYPLSGPNFDLLLIFAMREPEDSFPTIHLIDYQYIHVTQSKTLEKRTVGESPWGRAIDELCRRKLYMANPETK